jgi:hypothetical protein
MNNEIQEAGPVAAEAEPADAELGGLSLEQQLQQLLEASRFRPEDDLSRALSQDDPDRMKLTRQEHEHAMAIKRAVESTPELDNLSDFMYAHLALTCRDRVEDAIERCQGLQGCREEYNIAHTYEDGCRIVEKMFTLFPYTFPSVNFNQTHGIYMGVADAEKLDCAYFMSSSERIIEFIQLMYYLHHFLLPDLESARKGATCVIETMGMGMRKGFLKAMSLSFSEFVRYYPWRGEVQWHHSGSMVNVILSTLKRILPDEMKQYIVTGHNYNFDGHLGEILLTPSVEEANRKVILRAKDCLRRRFENERSFSLES